MSPTLREIVTDDGMLDLRHDSIGYDPTPTDLEDDTADTDDSVCELRERIKRRKAVVAYAPRPTTRKIEVEVARSIFVADDPLAVSRANGVSRGVMRRILARETYREVTESLTRGGGQ